MGYKWNPFTGNLDSDSAAATNVASAASLQITKVAYEHIFAGECVMAISNTDVALATNDTVGASALVLGIAANDALIGQPINVLIMGAFTNNAYSVFTINTLLFLDKLGAITDIKPSLPTSKFSTVVGKAIGGNTIFIQIGTPLTL